MADAFQEMGYGEITEEDRADVARVVAEAVRGHHVGLASAMRGAVLYGAGSGNPRHGSGIGMRSRGQAFTGWIVLVLYVASPAVATRSVVVCLEVDGGTAIEFADDHRQCLRDAAPGCETARAGQTECRESCCDSCPCEDSSLAVQPALAAKKNPRHGALLGATPDMLPWTVARPGLYAPPTPTRPHEGGAPVSEVTRRSLRTVVLLL